jgi:ElaB/YqjD/DUF883 family membrane-anchored ribosome-binding protein
MADNNATPTNNSSEGGTLVNATSGQGGSASPGADLSAQTGQGDFVRDANAPAGEPSTPIDPRQALKDGASKYSAQATDRIRTFADTGKAKAGGALDEFSTLLTDAAGQVDEKIGAQYGDYARQAAGMVSGFSDSIKNKDVDELLEDARGYVRQSPAIAIGVAAALGFVVARLVQSGIDTSAPTDRG